MARRLELSYIVIPENSQEKQIIEKIINQKKPKQQIVLTGGIKARIVRRGPGFPYDLGLKVNHKFGGEKCCRIINFLEEEAEKIKNDVGEVKH